MQFLLKHKKKLLILFVFILFLPLFVPLTGLGLFFGLLAWSSSPLNPPDCSYTMNNVTVSPNVENWGTGDYVMVYLKYEDTEINLWQKGMAFPHYKSGGCQQYIDNLMRHSYIDNKFIVFNHDNEYLNMRIGKRVGSEVKFVNGYMFFDKVSMPGYGIEDTDISELISIEEYLRKKIPDYNQMNELEVIHMRADENNLLNITFTGTASRLKATDVKFNADATFNDDMHVLSINSFTISE